MMQKLKRRGASLKPIEIGHVERVIVSKMFDTQGDHLVQMRGLRKTSGDKLLSFTIQLAVHASA